MALRQWERPWEELTPTDKKILWFLGLGANWIWRHPAETLVLGYYVSRNPLKGIRLIRLVTVETVRYSSRMTWGVAKIVAPEATKKIGSSASRARRFVNPIPEWVQTGSRFAKASFATSIFSTGVGMIGNQFDKANAGEFGTSEVLGDALMEAEFNMEGDKGYSPTMRPVRMHRMGGGGGILV